MSENRSKSANMDDKLKNEQSLDYISLLRDDTFDFYGIFSLMKLTFEQDKNLTQILSQAVPLNLNEEYQKAIPKYREYISKHYKEDEIIFNPMLRFNSNNYPKSFTNENIISYGEEDAKFKIQLCATYMKKIQPKSYKSIYFYMLSIRCLAHQPVDLEKCETEMTKRLYPWCGFEVYHVKGKKSEPVFLLFNFLEHCFIENSNGQQVMNCHFAKLEKVTYGYNSNEVIISVDSSLIVYRVKYAFQRTFLAETMRFALTRDLQVKVKSHYINPNDMNFNEQLKRQQDNLKLASEGYFKLIENDKIVPPKVILTYQAKVFPEYELFSKNKPLSDVQYLSLGINNIVIHRYQNYIQIQSLNKGIKFYGFIPFNCDSFYLEVTPDHKCLGLHVGQAKNYAFFDNEQSVANFREAIQVIKNKKIFVDSIFMNFQNEKSNQHLLKFKKLKLKEIYKKIDESKRCLEYFQGIKNQLEIQVMNVEFNAAMQMQQSNDNNNNKSSFIRSTTPNMRVVESKLIGESKQTQGVKSFAPQNSPSFQKSFNMTKTREPKNDSEVVASLIQDESHSSNNFQGSIFNRNYFQQQQ